MSAFLGPIHFWLYKKIQLQAQLVDEIVNLGKEKGFSDLDTYLNETYGIIENRPLEEMIDEGNIHGWLQAKVAIVESRLAESVTMLLKKDESSLADIEKLFFAHGEKQGEILAREEGITLSSIYKAIGDLLLDGMPCDHAVQLIKNEVDEVVWKRVGCVHRAYWQQVGGDVDNYYVLREAWLKGFTEALGVNYIKDDALTYRITRGE